jgi:hypothetical protein
MAWAQALGRNPIWTCPGAALIVVVAEKPSVARDLAKVPGARTTAEKYLEDQDIRVTWCIGHRLELAPPERYDPAWKRWSTDTLPMSVVHRRPRLSTPRRAPPGSCAQFLEAP